MSVTKDMYKREVIRITALSVLFVLCVGLSVVGLSSNSQGAKDRYDALIAVDQAGGDVAEALDELREYIYGHMNTQIGSDSGIKPPIQLQGTYERTVQTEKERVAAVNESLYATAQQDCERRLPAGLSGGNRLACIEAYVDANGEKEKLVDDALYKFDFAPPRWSPDLAGFSIVASIAIGVVLLVNVLLYFRTKHFVHMSR